MATKNRYLSSYREAEAQKIMDWIKMGQCGCLVGLREAGKSNFIQFLFRDETKRQQLGSDYTRFGFIHLDLLSLVDHSSWAVYELILERLIKHLHFLNPSNELLHSLNSLHKQVIHNRNALMAQRAVQQCIEALLQSPTQKLVLFLDEFDTLLKQVDLSLFGFLRDLRDSYKEQLLYIVVSNEIAYAQSDQAKSDRFYRLVNRNICGLGPYKTADAQQMIHYISAQQSIKLTEPDMARLLELSGGHAGLLKILLGLSGELTQLGGLKSSVSALLDEPSLRAECWKIWQDLPEIEQTALRQLARGTAPQSSLLRRLSRKGLLKSETKQPQLFSPLFQEFARQQTPPHSQGFSVDCATGQVYIDRELTATLSGLERQLLCFLFKKRGEVCTKDDIAENVYRERAKKEGVTDEMIQALIYRLRKKIEPNLDQPQYILVIRGEGYKIADE